MGWNVLAHGSELECCVETYEVGLFNTDRFVPSHDLVHGRQ